MVDHFAQFDHWHVASVALAHAAVSGDVVLGRRRAVVGDPTASVATSRLCRGLLLVHVLVPLCVSLVKGP